VQAWNVQGPPKRVTVHASQAQCGETLITVWWNYHWNKACQYFVGRANTRPTIPVSSAAPALRRSQSLLRVQGSESRAFKLARGRSHPAIGHQAIGIGQELDPSLRVGVRACGQLLRVCSRDAALTQPTCLCYCHGMMAMKRTNALRCAVPTRSHDSHHDPGPAPCARREPGRLGPTPFPTRIACSADQDP
jgi:hypothetical protein